MDAPVFHSNGAKLTPLIVFIGIQGRTSLLFFGYTTLAAVTGAVFWLHCSRCRYGVEMRKYQST